jgi:hypothetical protein
LSGNPQATWWQFRQETLMATGRDWRLAARSGQISIPLTRNTLQSNRQILSRLERGPHLGSTQNSHFRCWCPLFPRSRRQLPQPCLRRGAPYGALPGRIYRHARPESPSLGVWPGGVVMGYMPSPSSRRVASPKHLEARSCPLMAPDFRKGGWSARVPQCMLRSQSSLDRSALCMGTTSHHIRPHPTPPHPIRP